MNAKQKKKVDAAVTREKLKLGSTYGKFVRVDGATPGPILIESERTEDARLHAQAEHLSQKLEPLVAVSLAAGTLASALLTLTTQTGEDVSEQAIPLINMLFKKRNVPVAMLRSERKAPAVRQGIAVAIPEKKEGAP